MQILVPADLFYLSAIRNDWFHTDYCGAEPDIDQVDLSYGKRAIVHPFSIPRGKSLLQPLRKRQIRGSEVIGTRRTLISGDILINRL
ncbi:hypothetical protein D3C71_1056110 [compost metagenome]